MSNEGYTLNEDGTAVFEFAGIIRTLKRPTLGQYRSILESLGEFRDEVLRAAKAAEKGEAVQLKIGEQLDKLLNWIDGVFVQLAGEGLPRKIVTVEDTTGETPGSTEEVIDEDKLSPWLLSGVVVTELVTHWQSAPSRRGGQ